MHDYLSLLLLINVLSVNVLYIVGYCLLRTQAPSISFFNSLSGRPDSHTTSKCLAYMKTACLWYKSVWINQIKYHIKAIGFMCMNGEAACLLNGDNVCPIFCHVECECSFRLELQLLILRSNELTKHFLFFSKQQFNNEHRFINNNKSNPFSMFSQFVSPNFVCTAYFIEN